MSSSSTTWTTDTNTKSGTVQIYSSNVSVLKVIGDEGGNAVLDLFADQGDDNADKWRMWVNAGDDDLHFSNYTSGSAWTDILTLQDGGNVGIGTSSPGATLHVKDAEVAGTVIIESSSTNTDNTAPEVHLLRSNTTNLSVNDDIGQIRFQAYDNAGTPALFDYAGIRTIISNYTDGSEAGTISFQVAEGGSLATQMTIEGSNVGIGTTTPSSLLEIEASGGADSATIPRLTISNTFSGTYDAVNQDVGSLDFYSHDVSGDVGPGIRARIVHENDNAAGSTSNLGFYISNNTSLVKAMHLNTDGNVGIGTATPGKIFTVGNVSADEDTFIRIQCDTDNSCGIQFMEETTAKWLILNDGDDSDKLEVYDQSDTSVAVHIVAGGNAWVSDSDERIKKDIENIGSVLDDINSLRPVTYKKKYGKLGNTLPGFIAQEVKPHFPLLVTGKEDDFREVPAKDAVLDGNGNVIDEAMPIQFKGGLGLAYTDFIPYLIKAIQELSAKVTALESA
jgi:hypothetical protein